jgi:ligand-binding SRPBCC domain-containing protein
MTGQSRRARRAKRGAPMRILETEMFVAAPLAQVFAFFSDARNLERITPPWLSFRVVTPPPLDMRPGLHIEYRLRVHGFPLRWQSEIAAWEPPHRFVDVQRVGPYRRWRHEHAFREVDGGTWARDRVEYAAPGGWLAHRLFVDRDVRRIFEYRRGALEREFRKPAPAPVSRGSAATW